MPVVKPDLFNHPKFTLLRQRLGNSSLYYLVRLWTYAMTQKSEELGQLTPDTIETLCHWAGKRGKLWNAFTEKLAPDKSAWLDVDGSGNVRVHNFRKHNASLFRNFKGGAATKAKWEAKKEHEPTLEHEHKPEPEQERWSGYGLNWRELDCVDSDKMPARAVNHIPDSVEQVIQVGKALVPEAKTEEECRSFYSFYEAQAGFGPNGEKFWQTSSGAVITNWVQKLKSWNLDKKNPANAGAINAQIIQLTRYLRDTENDGDDATLAKRRDAKAELKILTEKQKGMTK